MNRADLWLGSDAPNGQPGNTEVRGMDTARLIAQRPSVIVITRDLPSQGDVQLAPQTVRIETVQNIRGGDERRDAMVSISHQYVVVVGYKDHPTIPDTDMLRADLFFYQSRMYEVVDFITTVPGRLLASCELTP